MCLVGEENGKGLFGAFSGFRSNASLARWRAHPRIPGYAYYERRVASLLRITYVSGLASNFNYILASTYYNTSS